MAQRTYNKRDANEPSIVKRMDELGIRHWMIQDGADWIVQNPLTGRLEFAEIKNPETADLHDPLTKREKALSQWCDANEPPTPYRVLWYADDVNHYGKSEKRRNRNDI